jgi:hypothetical protein
MILVERVGNDAIARHGDKDSPRAPMDCPRPIPADNMMTLPPRIKRHEL